MKENTDFIVIFNYVGHHFFHPAMAQALRDIVHSPPRGPCIEENLRLKLSTINTC